MHAQTTEVPPADELRLGDLLGNSHGLFMQLPGNRSVLLCSWTNFEEFLNKIIEIESYFVSLNGMQRFT